MHFYRILYCTLLVSTACCYAAPSTNARCDQSNSLASTETKCWGYEDFPRGIDERVTHLDLSSNSLKIIDNEVLKNFTNLNLLNLSNCEIKTIHPKAFSKLERLETLILSKNHLENFSKAFLKELKYLRHLDLSFNSFKNFEQGLLDDAEVSELSFLDVSNNLIDDMSDAFKGSLYLEVLKLSNNLLEDLDFLQAADLSSLTKLYLANNRIKAQTSSPFEKNMFLQVLDLSHNEIEKVPADFFKGTDLAELKLNGNKLQQVPASAIENFETTALDLSGNPIANIDGSSFLKSLYTSSIETLILTELPHLTKIGNHSFSPLTGLQEIIISKNHKLKEINPRAFDGLVDLKKLVLENNGLKTLQQFSLDFNSLEVVKLGGNEWCCDKRLSWMKHFQETKFDFRCHSPSYFAGRQFSSLTLAQLRAQHPSKRLVAALATIFGVIGLIAVLIVLWRYRKRIRSLRTQKRNPYETVASYDQEDGPRANIVMSCANEKAVLKEAADV